MIHYLTGDATRPVQQKTIVAHVCNNANRWGAGFSGAVGREYPDAEAAYRAGFKNDPFAMTLGQTQIVNTQTVWVRVANMIAQHSVRSFSNPKPIRYDALEACLNFVARTACRDGWVIQMPRIATGLAGGTWSEVEPIIQRTCSGVDVFVYDLPGDKS